MNKCKLLMISTTIITAMTVTACGHKNPLLNDDDIEFMKLSFQRNVEECSDPKNCFPIKRCAAYYAGKGNTSEKTTCDAWSEKFFTQLDYPKKVTLEDFRDKAFWMAAGGYHDD